MSDPEVSTALNIPIVYGAEVVCCTILNRHDRFEAYIKGNAASDVNTASYWRLYATPTGGVRAKIAQGSFADGGKATRIIWDNELPYAEGGGNLFELVVFGLNPVTGNKSIDCSLVGYDYSTTNPDNSVSSTQTIPANQVEQSFGSVAQSHRAWDIYVDLDSTSGPTEWILYARPSVAAPKVKVASVVLPATTLTGKQRVGRFTDIGSGNVELVGISSNTQVGVIASLVGTDDIVIPLNTVLQSANVAGLLALGVGVNEGEECWVATLRTYWYFASNAPSLVVDGITVQNTAVGGNSRWIRSQFSHEIWRVGHDTWHINSVTGNDENEGSTGITALKTPEELARRWGDGPVIQTTDPNLCINLFIDSDITAPNQLVLRPIFGPDTALRIFGGVTPVRTGIVTGYASQVPGTNTPAQLDDAAFVGAWELGERLRITSPGPSFNATCQIQNDLGGGSCNVSIPAYADESTFTTVPTALLPLVGDSYAVEHLRKIPIGFTKLQPSEWPSGFVPIIDFVDCNLLPVTAPPGYFQNLNFVEGEGTPYMEFVLYQCTIDLSCSMRGVVAVNSFFRVPQIELRQSAQINGGGAWVPAASPAYIYYSANDVYSSIDYNFQSWGLAFVATSQGSMASFAVFNASASIFNPGGHAVRIGNPGVYGPPTKFRFRGLLWGSGSLGVGLHVSATSSVEVDSTPTVTGGVGDGSIYLPVNTRAWDEAIGAYTAPIAFSWAAFDIAVALGGFGGNAHNLFADSHLIKNAAP